MPDTPPQDWTPPPAAAGGRAPYVLVVEDDPAINELVGAYVQLAGLDYRGATSGDAALREFGRDRPALVVLDVMLPDLDGFEICSRIKARPDAGRVPVVMLTAMDGGDSRQRAFACGAAEYLTKPFDPDQLLDAIARHAGRPV